MPHLHITVIAEVPSGISPNSPNDPLRLTKAYVQTLANAGVRLHVARFGHDHSVDLTPDVAPPLQ